MDKPTVRKQYWVDITQYGDTDNLWQAKVFTDSGGDTGASGMGRTPEAAEAEAWKALGALARTTKAEDAPAADEGEAASAVADDNPPDEAGHVGGGPKPSARKSAKSK